MATAAMDLGCLPSVIAIPLAEYQNPEERAVLRLWHACETVELTLRLAVAIGLADVRRGGALPEPLVKELRSKIERPSLGGVAGYGGGSCALAQKRRPHGDLVVPELPDFVLEQLAPLLEGPSPSDSPELSLIAMRNQLAHGGGVSQISGGTAPPSVEGETRRGVQSVRMDGQHRARDCPGHRVWRAAGGQDRAGAISGR